MSEHAQVSILLVGDQPARLEARVAALRALGAEVITASSGAEALQRLTTEDVAVVILDLSTRPEDGFKTAEILGRQARFEATPFVLLTSSPGTDDGRLAGWRPRLIDYAGAGLEPSILRDKVAALLDMHRQRREIERLRRELDSARHELASANRTRQLEATERARAEDALRQTEARLSIILESTSVAIGQIDLDNRFVYVNRGFEELFDLVGTDVRGRSLHELLRPEIAEAFEANCRRVLEDDRPHGFEEMSETADRMHAYNAVNSPIRDEEGNPCGVVCVFTDITERRRLESALLEADRRKDEFLAVLAHELRNPLSPILSAAKLMSLKPLEDPDLRWCGEVIKRQTEHLARLVDDLLDVARITQGKIALQCEHVRIADAVARAVEANRPLADERKQHLFIDVPEPSPKVYGDLTRLSQVIGNLINNAVKYTESGGIIRVSVEQVTSERSSAGDVLLRVSDSGMGIPADMLPRIFELFTQIDNRARPQGGLGIGLALVARLVQMHGGSITARSEGPNRGSEFVVRLPALRDSPHSAAEPKEGAARPSAASRLSVLVVDDNKDAAESLAILLRMAGHLVETAHDGLEAVAAAERFRPAVVLMDLGMPRLDGYGAAQRIRAQEWGQEAQIIALTGWGQDDARTLTALAGFDAHLVKPVDFDELARLMEAGGGRTAPALGAVHERP